MIVWYAVEVAPKSSFENTALLLGIVGSLIMAAVAMYRARPQRALDAATKERVEAEVKVSLEAHDLEKTRRIMRLESYVTQDVRYHRRFLVYDEARNAYQAKLVALLQQCIDSGQLPGAQLPDAPGEPPEPPDLPEVDE